MVARYVPPASGGGGGGAPVINVALPPYSADTTGATDCTTAFQDALNAAGQVNGWEVYAPAGNYLFNGTLTIPPGVELVGDRRSVQSHAQHVYTVTQPPVLSSGTLLMTTAGSGSATGTPFITISANSVLEGVQIYYPNQPAGSSPTAYPFAVAFATGECGCIRRCSFPNAYQAIQCFNHFRPTINEIGGQPLLMGLQIDGCRDVAWINQIQWVWDLNVMDNDATIIWTRANGTGFDFGRVDEAKISQCFCYSYHIGFKFRASVVDTGGPWASLFQCGADAGTYGIYVSDVGSDYLIIVGFSGTGGCVLAEVGNQSIIYSASSPISGFVIISLVVSPTSGSVVDASTTLSITPTLANSTAPLTAAVSGGGTISTAAPTSGTPFTYTPPTTGTGTAVVTVTDATDNLSATCTISYAP